MLKEFTELLHRHASLISELQAHHANRAYHNWGHILAILSLASRYPHLINDLEAFFWMAVFHDVIYDSKRHDNEEKSADAARERLAKLVSPVRLILICAGICSTAKHEVPDGLSPTDQRDISFFLDCDLAILGTDSLTFRAYDVAIRNEYDWVEEPQWRTGRAGVMQKFLKRDKIYFTSEMHEEFESRARHNLAALIKELSVE